VASGTLERQTEVVTDKVTAAASVTGAAKSESKATVPGSNVGEARAWDAKAQID
jgi:hypothetical protein